MTPRAAFIRWGLIGVVAAAVMLAAQAQAVGGAAGLLQVGETSAVRPLIESQLGEVPGVPGSGHDGQIYYAIGLDLNGDEVAPLLNHGAYRYRRVLYPLLASGFGLLDGWALLTGMMVLAVAAAGVAAGAVAATATLRGLPDWLALAVIINPGVWLSIRLLSGDILALALMIVGLYFVAAGRRRSGVAFALSALAKDVYLTTPAGLAIHRDRRRWFLVLIPLAVLALWATWLTVTLGDGFTGRGNFALPFTGIVEGSANWENNDAEEWLYIGFALASVIGGLVVSVIRRSWLRWSILAWSVLGLVSSNWVWDLGNNAARAFAPIAVLIVLAGGHAATRDEAGLVAAEEPVIS